MIKVEEAVSQMKSADPQTSLNQGSNLWIVKPCGLSRGRGIYISNNMIDILHYIVSSDCDFIVQKFIENAMLVRGRRFDIRQLVFVTSFDPLEVFAYDDFYVRICAKEYKDEKAGGDPSDLFSALANNSISKNSSETKIFHENMMFMHEFDEYMK